MFVRPTFVNAPLIKCSWSTIRIVSIADLHVDDSQVGPRARDLGGGLSRPCSRPSERFVVRPKLYPGTVKHLLRGGGSPGPPENSEGPPSSANRSTGGFLEVERGDGINWDWEFCRERGGLVFLGNPSFHPPSQPCNRRQSRCKTRNMNGPILI